MSYLVAIDPGFNGTGVALLLDGELVSTALVKPPPEHAATFGERLKAAVRDFRCLGFPAGVAEHVIEFPDRDDRKGEIVDIFKPAALSGALAVACVGPVSFVFPSEWKGNVPKDVHNDRVLAGLTKKELAQFMAAGYGAADSHNVIDAIGLGKWRYSNPRFLSRLGNSSTPLRSRIRKAKASGKF